jgi:shikimate 5-dehydrogenase
MRIAFLCPFIPLVIGFSNPPIQLHHPSSTGRFCNRASNFVFTSFSRKLDSDQTSLRGGSQDLSMSTETQGLLRGSRVLVTGGGRGIGRAIALICAEEGADVAVLSRTQAEVQEVADHITKQYGTRSLSVCADVTNEDQVESAISEVVAKFGGIDILVNNAGAACEKLPGHQQSASAFRQLLDVNVVSALIVSSQVLNKCMLAQKAGSIINISSRAGKVPAAQCRLLHPDYLSHSPFSISSFP